MNPEACITLFGLASVFVFFLDIVTRCLGFGKGNRNEGRPAIKVSIWEIAPSLSVIYMGRSIIISYLCLGWILSTYSLFGFMAGAASGLFVVSIASIFIYKARGPFFSGADFPFYLTIPSVIAVSEAFYLSGWDVDITSTLIAFSLPLAAGITPFMARTVRRCASMPSNSLSTYLLIFFPSLFIAPLSIGVIYLIFSVQPIRSGYVAVSVMSMSGERIVTRIPRIAFPQADLKALDLTGVISLTFCIPDYTSAKFEPDHLGQRRRLEPICSLPNSTLSLALNPPLIRTEKVFLESSFSMEIGKLTFAPDPSGLLMVTDGKKSRDSRVYVSDRYHSRFVFVCIGMRTCERYPTPDDPIPYLRGFRYDELAQWKSSEINASEFLDSIQSSRIDR